MQVGSRIVPALTAKCGVHPSGHSMLEFIRSLVAGLAGPARATPPMPRRENAAPPLEISINAVEPFVFSTHFLDGNAFPIPDWDAARQWVAELPDEAQRVCAWALLRRGWLEHMRQALGPCYALHETEHAMLVSSLEDHVAMATLAYVRRTQQRVAGVLEGIAQIPAGGKEIIIVFDDEPEYYEYVSHCYDTEGEFAGSGGMFISSGGGHFVTVKAELQALEPVIAHELTHSCVRHLPIPLWLNEGLAVNTEHRLCGRGRSRSSPMQMHARHQAFWDTARIQEFWSGQSFLRADEGNELSYDLARIVVAQLGRDWPALRAFVLEAHSDDGGAAAAIGHLHCSLGSVVAALLERPSNQGLEPEPTAWESEEQCDATESGS